MEPLEKLGKYEIKRTLGRGAMGVVYDGWDPIIQRHVAIKTVPIADSDDPETEEALARFKREAQAAGRLVHPNIVGVFDYGETDDLAYIVMEYIEGPTLKSLMEKQERFALADIMKIMHDLLAGLQFSHERGVVHRDIKPANIMLTSADRDKSRAKIADFGIARIESSSMTQAGTMMGTPTYMSPEQFMAQTVDARTDIYSSGVLLYQLLTGERPFEGSLSAIMHKALHTEPPAPSAISVTSPPAFDAVVKKAMAKRPDERFASAADFAAALDAAASGKVQPEEADAGEATMVAAPRPAARQAAPATQPAAVAAAPAPKRNMVVPIAAGVAVLVAGGLGGLFFLMKPGQDMARAPTPPPAVVATTPAPPAPTLPPPTVATQPATPATPAAEPARAMNPAVIREQIAQIVAAQRCALIDGSVRDNGDTVLTGIAGPGAQEEIRQIATSRDIAGTLQWRAANADAVFCQPLELLQSIAPAFGAAEPRLNLALADGRTKLRDGERIRPRLTLPNFTGYLRVDYIAHDGNVQHLYPQSADKTGVVADPVRSFAPAERLNLGDPKPGQPAWEAGEPYGVDMIIAIASSEPLFEQPRPANVESAGTYLRDLEAAVSALRGGGVRMVGSALLVEALPK